ncbi:hypothetical protein RHDE110596_00570 [Prescottella defluvii]|uniref:hypothetical protein n=1 Tax=Prescottella defluvii TaxID=1323361 RepID=UPI0004F36FE4|nr:hypothetical protein [Prescottella defluvii]
MNEAALGIHANGSEPATDRPEPPEPIPVGVTLPELLAVARLTPAQAAQLVADLTDQSELVGRGSRPVAVRADTTMVSDDGRLTIDDSGSVASRIEVAGAVEDLLRSIAANCRGSGFGDNLTESISGTTDLDDLLHRARLVVTPELDPADEARRRRGIGDLVRATRGRPLLDGPAAEGREDRTDVQNGSHLPAGSLAPSTGWYPPVRRVWHSRRRRLSRRQVLFALLTIVVLVAVAVTAPRAWEQLRRGWDALVDPVNTSEPNVIEPVSPPPPEPADPAGAAAGGVAPGPVDTGAPAAAGQIAGVTASFADGSCSPGRSCAVRVDVRLDPSAVGAVTWKLNVYDRCTGEVREGGEVTMPAEQGRDGVYGLSRTTLPAGSALAVAAVTSAPAVAASEPLYVPAENATC